MHKKSAYYKILIFFIGILISSCSSADKFYKKTGFLVWGTFADQLGTGSSATEGNSIITGDGDAVVSLVKAAHPQQGSAKNSHFPYAGAFFFFDKKRKPVDLSGYDNMLITYSLKGQLSLMLSQSDIPEGQEYRVELPAAESYTQAVFKWEDFAQPTWVTKPQALDQRKITGVKFKITAREKTSSTLNITTFSLQ